MLVKLTNSSVLAKALSPILKTLEGIIKLSIASQCEKDLFPIDFKLFGKVKVVKRVQFSNALSPITSNLLFVFNSTLVKFVQL